MPIFGQLFLCKEEGLGILDMSLTCKERIGITEITHCLGLQDVPANLLRTTKGSRSQTIFRGLLQDLLA